MTTARYQNPNSQVQEGLVVAHTVYGEAVAGSVRPEQNGLLEGRIQPVTQPHQRHYQPPKRRHRDHGGQLCSYEDCKSYPTKRWAPYCAGHAVTMGLRENPKKAAASDNTD